MELVLTYAVIVAFTIAIVNRIKAEVPEQKPWAYTLMSIAIGAVLYAISLYAPPVVSGFILIGGAAAGIFDVTKKAE